MLKPSILASFAIAGLTILAASSNAQADTVKIMAKPKCSPWWDTKDVGHVAIAFYDSRGNLTATRGMWPGGVQYGYNNGNDSEDKKLARGVGCNVKIRAASISQKRREWLQNDVATANGTDCKKYSYVFMNFADKSTCTCVNFGTRVWRVVTADRERWQGMVRPDEVATAIDMTNKADFVWHRSLQKYGLFNQGIVWQ